ncbi:hypothetical protein CTAM01_09522 [Colletotrichum tamarilloi]|uniref:Uncharacterized protein n=1 Tax=Colletotrichum tamarilloi TaxID=1209934 RepID=A0ABQ9R2Y1_9PEZI|nr:uncharacterized protein CTAM01_09522 [Colletotrichum tamarilloi]KAK1493114.1 hypothetical protein CTAM01_09522 [Colletotrichum tamarilloi]
MTKVAEPSKIFDLHASFPFALYEPNTRNGALESQIPSCLSCCLLQKRSWLRNLSQTFLYFVCPSLTQPVSGGFSLVSLKLRQKTREMDRGRVPHCCCFLLFPLRPLVLSPFLIPAPTKCKCTIVVFLCLEKRVRQQIRTRPPSHWYLLSKGGKSALACLPVPLAPWPLLPIVWTDTKFRKTMNLKETCNTDAVKPVKLVRSFANLGETTEMDPAGWSNGARLGLDRDPLRQYDVLLVSSIQEAQVRRSSFPCDDRDDEG